MAWRKGQVRVSNTTLRCFSFVPPFVWSTKCFKKQYTWVLVWLGQNTECPCRQQSLWKMRKPRFKGQWFVEVHAASYWLEYWVTGSKPGYPDFFQFNVWHYRIPDSPGTLGPLIPWGAPDPPTSCGFTIAGDFSHYFKLSVTATWGYMKFILGTQE